ncbi:MAG: MlaD family protein [Verrucomicrobiota bacterium]
MSNQTNPRAIGIFVSVAIALLAVFVVYFGSVTFSQASTRYILFFDQSVNGLSIGSEVKFRGVPIGSVDKILLRVKGQSKWSNSIPVIIKIDHGKLQRELYDDVPDDVPRTTEQMLARGMVAKLSLESFITGLLFVEFSVEPEGGYQSPDEIRTVGGLTEIPTLGTSLDEITADMAHVIAQVAAINLGELINNLDALFISTNMLIKGIDSYAITDAVVGAAAEVKELVSSAEIEATLVSVQEALKAFESTTDSFNLDTGPVGQMVEAWRKDFSTTLNGLDELVANANGMVAPDSNLRFEFEQSLRDLSQAAKSLKRLADYLETNPNAVITGRPE